jgi:hypothetical protein
MPGNKHGVEPIAIQKLREIADKLVALADKVNERTQAIEATRVAEPEMGNVKNANRALKYLNGYSLALVSCLDGIEAAKKAKARANQALDAEAKANKRPRKST